MAPNWWNCVERGCNKSGHVRADALKPFHGSEVAIGGAIGPLNGPEHCIYGQFGASFSPYSHLERPFQVRKLVPAGRPGCVLSRSSLVPSCATHSGSPRLPMARTLHLWPFLALFGHKMGQNGWNKKHMLWISIQVDPNDNLKALVLAKQKLEKR